MGEGALAGMPLQLAGTRKILEFMDWGEYGAMGTFISIGAIGNWESKSMSNIAMLQVSTLYLQFVNCGDLQMLVINMLAVTYPLFILDSVVYYISFLLLVINVLSGFV